MSENQPFASVRATGVAPMTRTCAFGMGMPPRPRTMPTRVAVPASGSSVRVVSRSAESSAARLARALTAEREMTHVHAGGLGDGDLERGTHALGVLHLHEEPAVGRHAAQSVLSERVGDGAPRALENHRLDDALVEGELGPHGGHLRTGQRPVGVGVGDDADQRAGAFDERHPRTGERPQRPARRHRELGARDAGTRHDDALRRSAELERVEERVREPDRVLAGVEPLERESSLLVGQRDERRLALRTDTRRAHLRALDGRSGTQAVDDGALEPADLLRARARRGAREQRYREASTGRARAEQRTKRVGGHTITASSRR